MGILPRTDTVPENAALVNYSAKVNYGKGRHGDMLALKGCARHAQLRSSWQSQELGDGELRRQEAILFEQGWRRCLQRRLEQVPRQQGAPVLQHRPETQLPGRLWRGRQCRIRGSSLPALPSWLEQQGPAACEVSPYASKLARSTAPA